MATLDELLESTSRTFALAIPLLPEPERLDVTLGYLVFRIADTLEDAENLGRDDRIAGLDGFIELLGAPSADAAERFAARWSATPPSTSADYNLLL
ncbi:MAG: squalene/phytoene synthase family protein, partial [Planctomycetota bacterium]